VRQAAPVIQSFKQPQSRGLQLGRGHMVHDLHVSNDAAGIAAHLIDLRLRLSLTPG
jgi:hypothetical protein